MGCQDLLENTGLVSLVPGNNGPSRMSKGRLAKSAIGGNVIKRDMKHEVLGRIKASEAPAPGALIKWGKPRSIRAGSGALLKDPTPPVSIKSLEAKPKPKAAPDKTRKALPYSKLPANTPPPQGPPRPPEMRAAHAAAVAARRAAAAAPHKNATAKPKKRAEIPAQPVPAPAIFVRTRHWVVLLSFLIFVLVPAAITAWYLWERAQDQFASTVGFSVRKEEVSSAVELLGGITEFSGSSSSDTDILYEFLQSQSLVAEIDAAVDLHTIWSKPQNDPIFALSPGGTIEDLLAYWERMVTITYDSGAGLIEVRVLAFDPQDATRISVILFERASEMINNLSAIAREDAIGYARIELQNAVKRLKSAREAVLRFRNENQLVDPAQDTQVQAGLLGTLQAQLAEALIDLDILRDTTRTGDHRLLKAQRRVNVIETRLAAERQKMGIGSTAPVGEVLANLVSEYERLVVDREFAERSYTSALAAYDASQAEARRKSRYLAAHVLPTRAESSRFPDRWTLFGLTTLFLFLTWSILTLIAYAIKDRG